MRRTQLDFSSVRMLDARVWESRGVFGRRGVLQGGVKVRLLGAKTVASLVSIS